MPRRPRLFVAGGFYHVYCRTHRGEFRFNDSSESKSFIDNAYDKAQSVLKDNIDILHHLSEVLLEKETVMGSELDAIILEMRPGFDFPSKHEPVPTPAPEKSEKADESPEAVAASEAEDATEDSAAAPSGDDESDDKG